MKKTLYLAVSLLVLAACGCGKPQTLPIIPSGQEPGTGGKETIPEPGITYATEVLTLPATARDHYQIYQVNLKLYGNSGAFGKVQARLDEIKALGTDILYLMPVYAEGKTVLPGMPGNNPFGSPYCIKNYKEVNSLYGTLDELKALVNAAKAKGMKVMFDWVANHTSWDNVWLTEHPEWYEHKADGSIAWPTKDGEWKDVAQLDFGKKELWAAMEDALQYWVTEVGIDGYRCDYAHGVRDDFWKEAIGKLKALKPGFIMLAESDFTGGVRFHPDVRRRVRHHLRPEDEERDAESHRQHGFHQEFLHLVQERPGRGSGPQDQALLRDEPRRRDRGDSGHPVQVQRGRPRRLCADGRPERFLDAVRQPGGGL